MPEYCSGRGYPGRHVLGKRDDFISNYHLAIFARDAILRGIRVIIFYGLYENSLIFDLFQIIGKFRKFGINDLRYIGVETGHVNHFMTSWTDPRKH